MKTIVVDMMGADHGIAATSEGVRLFLARNNNVKLILVGDSQQLDHFKDVATIVASKTIVPMSAGTLEALRMKDSSMVVAINTMLEQKADAIVSAGSTGGFLSLATLKLKLIEGVERAALMSPFPTAVSGKKAIVLDIGANNENSASQLVQFAKMGSVFARKVYHIEQPAVYLLSNGTEPEKGPEEIVAAHKMMKEMNFLGFKGNTEGREALSGQADVIVTSGFAGNIFLKGSEGIFSLMNGLIKKAFKRNIFSKIGYLLSSNGFKQMKKGLDYKTYGGAMLLGVNGVVVKAHGSSDGYSFSYALELALKMAQSDIINVISEDLK